MKTFKLLIVAAALATVSGMAEAQLLKKTGGAAKDAAGRIIEDKGKQTVSYACTMSKKGKPFQKEYYDAQNGFVRYESINDNNITVMRMDSAAIYFWDASTKKGTVMTFNGAQRLPDILQKRTGVDNKEEFRGVEKINGYDCHHYINSSTHKYPDGHTETGCTESWIEESLGVLMQTTDCNMREDMLTIIDFSLGPQPAGLFEIPKDVVFSDLSKQMDNVKKEIDNMKNMFESLGKDMKSKGVK
jgi:hypothetical protein